MERRGGEIGDGTEDGLVFYLCHDLYCFGYVCVVEGGKLQYSKLLYEKGCDAVL